MIKEEKNQRNLKITKISGSDNIPELRFPEFKNEGEWGKKELGEIADNLDSKRVPITSTVREKGSIPYYGASGIIDYVKDYIYDERLLCISEDGANLIDRNYPIAFSISGKTWVNNHAHVLKFENTNTQILVEKFINSINIEDFLTGLAQPKLNRGKLDIIPIPLPKNPAEQQKIASCLSSLDEVIAAHSQKLELLKDHKKGLMQNLFPHPSTSSGGGSMAEPVEAKVPKFRFKEFENDEEWVEKKLGELTLKVGSGVTPLGGETVYKKNGRPFVRSQNVGWGIFLLENVAFIDEETHQDSISTEIKVDDVLLNITGASIGRSAVANKKISGGNVNQHVCIIRTQKKFLNPFFLCQYLISNYGQKQIDSFQAGGNRQGLNFAQIRSLSIPIPPTILEQQKIAACLSSLDALIAAQMEKIEQLKLHKKGLMQGLFPKTV